MLTCTKNFKQEISLYEFFTFFDFLTTTFCKNESGSELLTRIRIRHINLNNFDSNGTGSACNFAFSGSNRFFLYRFRLLIKDEKADGQSNQIRKTLSSRSSSHSDHGSYFPEGGGGTELSCNFFLLCKKNETYF